MKRLPNLNFLRYFYSAGKHSSISKAAEENFVTQSAISQGIDKLELELDKKLLSNRKNRFELTPDGEFLLNQCERLLATFDEISHLFNEKEGVYRGKFSFATSHSLAICFFPTYYQKLFSLHPQAEPLLRLGHSGIVREWVAKGTIEFGIILAKERDDQMFNTRSILQGVYRFYEAPTGIKRGQDKLIISEDSNEDRQMIQYLKTQEKKLPPILEVLSWEVIARMVLHGLGIGVLPDYVARAHALVPTHETLPALPYSIIAIWPRKKQLSRNAQMFIELIENQKT
jgi:DNA-binding transcriptional LysR family regulator